MTESEPGSWAALEPTAAQRRRIQARLHNWLDARETSLAAEWLGLFKLNPVTGFVFATVSACLVLITTPLGWLAIAAL
jgi:hypothetical protein